jgi:molybdopterin synthase catalytic subunit
MAELVDRAIDVQALTRAATRPDCGAVTLFLGTTRDHHDGRRVTRLAYEAYAPMALAALAAIENAARERFAIVSCAITHRLGEVPAGEASVAVLVAAEHRGPAFDACRWAMDELKRSVPIWKKEFYDSGDGAWVEGKPL